MSRCITLSSCVTLWYHDTSHHQCQKVSRRDTSNIVLSMKMAKMFYRSDDRSRILDRDVLGAAVLAEGVDVSAKRRHMQL